MLRKPAAVLALVLAALPVAAMNAPTISDGDTLQLNGTVFRLYGLDAPEKNQLCADGWNGGEEAKKALEALVAGAKVECRAITKDSQGRTVGTCSADGEDIGADLVRQGMAWAHLKYSLQYLPEEMLARWDGVGIHGRKCDKPWDWLKKDKR